MMIKVCVFPSTSNTFSKMFFTPSISTSVSLALCAPPYPHSLLTAFSSPSFFAGRDHPPAFVQCGCCSALRPQRGQEHLVCHDTTLAGHLTSLMHLSSRLPARATFSLLFLPQWTVGIIILGPTVPHLSRIKIRSHDLRE